MPRCLSRFHLHQLIRRYGTLTITHGHRYRTSCKSIICELSAKPTARETQNHTRNKDINTYLHSKYRTLMISTHTQQHLYSSMNSTCCWPLSYRRLSYRRIAPNYLSTAQQPTGKQLPKKCTQHRRHCRKLGTPTRSSETATFTLLRRRNGCLDNDPSVSLSNAQTSGLLTGDN